VDRVWVGISATVAPVVGPIAAVEHPGGAFDFHFQEFAGKQAGHRGVVLDELKFDVERLLHEILQPLGQSGGLSPAVCDWSFIGRRATFGLWHRGSFLSETFRSRSVKKNPFSISNFS